MTGQAWPLGGLQATQVLPQWMLCAGKRSSRLLRSVVREMRNLPTGNPGSCNIDTVTNFKTTVADERHEAIGLAYMADKPINGGVFLVELERVVTLMHFVSQHAVCTLLFTIL